MPNQCSAEGGFKRTASERSRRVGSCVMNGATIAAPIKIRSVNSPKRDMRCLTNRRQVIARNEFDSLRLLAACHDAVSVLMDMLHLLFIKNARQLSLNGLAGCGGQTVSEYIGENLPFCLIQADSRVQQCIGNIGDHISYDNHDRGNQQDTHCHREISIADRVQSHPAHPRPGED